MTSEAMEGVLSMPCPVCEAAPGDRCRTWAGKLTAFPHVPRLDAWRNRDE